MISGLLTAFHKWNDLISSCPKCKKETVDRVVFYENYCQVEAEIKCKDCNIVVAYWAYGGYDGPTTKIESFWYWWYFTKLRIIRFLRLK